MVADLLVATSDRLDVSREAAIARFDAALDPRDVPVGRPVASPDALIGAYEQLLATDGASRARAGAWFTPALIVAGVLDRAAVQPGERVLDPACGAGAFLLAASRRGARVSGMDLDPVAVAVAKGVLWWESGAPWSHFGGADVRVGDALLHDWDRRFDVVVGNPPFLGQLAKATVHSRARAAALAARWGATAYADAAALFQLLAASLLEEGGRSALLAPASWLAARDAGPLRARLAAALSPQALWLATDRTFPDAAVYPALVVLRRGPGPDPVARFVDAGFRRASPVSIPGERWRSSARWSGWFAGAVGIPEVDLGSGPCLGEVAEITADFRDQYYGLTGSVREGEGARLITVGAIGLGRCGWGTRPIRFARQTWRRPVVDRRSLSPALAAWAERRARPKLLLATQTRVVEVIADAAGAWLPSVPVISVVPNTPTDLWHLGAALASPPATAWAASLCLGTGLSPNVIKLAARDVRELPLPPPGPAWDDAAQAFRALEDGADPVAFGRLAIAAYGLPLEPLLSWWTRRLRAGRLVE